MKVPFLPEDMLLSFISPTFSSPPGPVAPAPGMGPFYLCSASSLETPGLRSRATWKALSMAFVIALLLFLCGHPQAAAGKGQGGNIRQLFGKFGGAAAFPP